MRLLLDTHVILWWLDDDPKLGRRARRLIAEADTVLVGMASLWEVAVKHRIGKLKVRARDITDRLEIDDFTLVPINKAHIDMVETFRDAAHGDPFDHLILAQAASEHARLVTNDAQMRHYGVPCISTD